MSSERPWVRHELPWLRSGPLFRVHVDALAELGKFLDQFGYLRIDLDGRRMISRHDAHAEIARAFEFPDYYGKNWDAFNDCLLDFVAAHDGELVAVVWSYVEAMAVGAPATAAEVGWALLDGAFGYMPTVAPDIKPTISMDVFVIGEGSDFDRP